MPNSSLPRIDGQAANAGAPMNCSLDRFIADEASASFADLWLAQVAASLAIEVPTIGRFAALAARHGIAVDMARFALDLGYAYRLLARSHACADGEIRQLAMLLFEACQGMELRRMRWAGLHPLH